MEGYGYPYNTPYPQMRGSEGEYPDHGDGFGEYYGVGPLNEDRGRSKNRLRRSKETKRTRSTAGSLTQTRSRSQSRSRSRSRSKSRSRSRSQSRSQSHARTQSRSRSGTRPKEFNYKEPSFLDAFRVLYLTPSKSKKNPSKFLATRKRQDHIQEALKRDGLGSKRWFFYPRQKNNCNQSEVGEVPGTRDNCDQRIKVDGDFFRKYKRSKKIDANAPIAKLKRWELIFYKKLGFIEAV